MRRYQRRRAPGRASRGWSRTSRPEPRYLRAPHGATALCTWLEGGGERVTVKLRAATRPPVVMYARAGLSR